MMRRLALALAVALLLAPAVRAAEVEAAYGYDHLDRGYADWQAATLEVVTAPAEKVELRGGLRATERFGLRDLEVSAGAVTRRLGRWALSAEGSFSFTHRVLPAAALGLGAARELGGGVVAGVGLRGVEYRTDAGRSDGALGSAGLEWYVRSWRLAGTGYLATLGGEWTGAGRVALDRFYGEDGQGGRAGLALATGTDLENTGSRILRTQVLSAALSGRHPLGDRWSIVWEASAQRQGHAYTRLGGRLGIRRRF